MQRVEQKEKNWIKRTLYLTNTMQPKTWDFSLAFNIKFIERIGERDHKFSWRSKNAPKTRRLFKIGKVGKPTILILLTYDKAR